MKSKNNLLLCGFKGSGKSYFARKLSLLLNRPYIDTDALIEQQYALPCREIALEIGQIRFRLLEKEVISSLIPTQNSIIALGGGSLLDPENQKSILSLGKLIYLIADPETLKKRILQGPCPSFLDPSDFDASFEKIFQQRKLLFDQIPSHRIRLEGKNDEQILCEIISIL